MTDFLWGLYLTALFEERNKYCLLNIKKLGQIYKSDQQITVMSQWHLIISWLETQIHISCNVSLLQSAFPLCYASIDSASASPALKKVKGTI